MEIDIANLSLNIWNHNGFLTDDYKGMSPAKMRNHIHMVNPRKMYLKVIEHNHFYDRYVLDMLIDLKVDLTQDKLICLNEWNRSIVKKISELEEFLNKEGNRFKYVEYANR